MNDRYRMRKRAAKELTPVYFNVYEIRKCVRESDGAYSFIHDCVECYKVKNLSLDRVMSILGELRVKWKHLNTDGTKHRVLLEKNEGESETPWEWRNAMMW